jgi:hypothetical protein
MSSDNTAIAGSVGIVVGILGSVVVAASPSHTPYVLAVAALLVFAGVGLRIESALRSRHLPEARQQQN